MSDKVARATCEAWSFFVRLKRHYATASISEAAESAVRDSTLKLFSLGFGNASVRNAWRTRMITACCASYCGYRLARQPVVHCRLFMS